MVARHVVDLAVFLAQAQPPAFVLRIVVFHFEGDHGSYAGDGKDPDGNERAIARADHGSRVHAVEQLAGFGPRK